MFLKNDLSSGTWTYQCALNPADRGQASHYIEVHDRVPRDKSLDRLIAHAGERNFSPEALAYRHARQEKAPALRDQEQRHEIALHQEKAAQRLLAEYGVHPKQLQSGRFGRLNVPSDLDRLVCEPRGLGSSGIRPTDKVLVFTERPLDAIGYERAKGNDQACYMCTGSTPTEETLRKIAHIVPELPAGMTIVLAFGRDEGGRRLAEQVRALAPLVKMEHEPPPLGGRWADPAYVNVRPRSA